MAAKAVPTILDWLNEDCWRLVLGYVPVEDIIRSECVSRQWQGMVHSYLQDVGLCVQRYHYPFSTRHRGGRMIVPLKGRSESTDHQMGYIMMMANMGMEGKESRWTKIVKKWGEYITALECSRAENLKLVLRHCPNLEELMLAGIKTEKIKRKEFHFKKLRRISFQFSESLPDSFVTKFLVNPTLEELVFDRNIGDMTGTCLSELKSNLKSIQFNFCFDFDFQQLLLSDRMSNLTKLDLSECGRMIKDLHLLFENTPNLECLYLDSYNDMESEHKDLLEAMSRLSRLKQISLMRNNNVRDNWLEALSRCPLRSVDVSVCDEVTGRGLAALCQGAGRTLTEIGLEGNVHVTHEDLLACILACPNLKALNVGWVALSLDKLAHGLAAMRGDIPRGLRVRFTDEKEWRRVMSKQAKGVAKKLDFVDLNYYPAAPTCYPWMQEMRTSKRR